MAPKSSSSQASRSKRKSSGFCQLAAVMLLVLFGLFLPSLFFDHHDDELVTDHHHISPNAPVPLRQTDGEQPTEAPTARPVPPAKRNIPKKIQGLSPFDDRVKTELVPFLQHAAAVERKNEARTTKPLPQSEILLNRLYEPNLKFLISDLGVTCYDMCKRESMQCAKDWLLLFNNCELMQKFFPAAKECTNEFFGRDLPAFRPSTNSILLNSQGKTWLPSCGASHDLTQRICGCEGSADEKPMTFHTIFNCQSSPYFDWQSRYSYFHFKKSGMPGNYTRLLSAEAPDHLVDEVPTFVAKAWDLTADNYLPYNKPYSMKQWLEAVEVREDVIVLLDPDCLIVSKIDIPVREGAPIAQQGYYFFKDDEPDSIEMQICKRYCPTCEHFDPIAVPVIIHRNDAKRLVPLWLEKIKQIRADRPNWPESWTSKKFSSNSLEWVAEMYGYVIAAAELGLRHDLWNLQAVPSADTLMRRPVIHYHTAVKFSNGITWNKHDDKAGTDLLVWPVPSGTDEVKTKLMEALNEAKTKLPPLQYKWPENWGYSQAKP